MRTIDTIAVHCSATKASMNVTVDQIRKWHLDRGWSDIGYHWFIDRKGDLHAGRPEEKAGAHVKGHNHHSIGICMAGGLNNDTLEPEDNFTEAQYHTLERVIRDKLVQYPTITTVKGHRDFPNVHKACPCFDVREWMTTIGLSVA